jgi:hypothetical protein
MKMAVEALGVRDCFVMADLFYLSARSAIVYQLENHSHASKTVMMRGSLLF